MRAPRNLACILAALAFLGCAEPAQDQPSTDGSATVLQREPLQMLDAQGLADLVARSEGQVLLLNLWATWCAPCLKEIPELIRLQNAHRDDGLRVIGISLDTDQRNSDVTAFRDKHFPGFASYLSTEPEWDLLIEVIDPAWDAVLPTSFVIDRNGNLAQVLVGGKPYETFAEAVGKHL